MGSWLVDEDPPPYPSLYGGEYIVLEVGILLEVRVTGLCVWLVDEFGCRDAACSVRVKLFVSIYRTLHAASLQVGVHFLL